MDERQRIAEVYGDRARTLKADHYSLFESANLHRLQGRERATLRMLRRHDLADLSSKRILEVGCGAGGELLRLVGWGADPASLAGVDLLTDRVARARHLLPHADLHVGDARALPFAAATFDLVMQLTVFSSVLDPAIRLAIAQ
ncbi:MAG: methyltransferase domain-containing protein, partial [Cyanobacteria bacterium REEB65]|nr:methyltransferase domain-containing protein [Cyanobacteria bacterium REEB65]